MNLNILFILFSPLTITLEQNISKIQATFPDVKSRRLFMPTYQLSGKDGKLCICNVMCSFEPKVAV